jgi:acyl-CoA reductase-like NAD-dependent aldehyde dehydrogenase
MISIQEEICTVHAADTKDVDMAVEAARRAFNGEWRTLDSSSFLLYSELVIYQQIEI